MSEFNQHDLYDLLNRNRPLWVYKVDLSNADLTYAILEGAVLVSSNLAGANLYRANLKGERIWASQI
jgi:uncharacterized protein YjbI with pentapeptide repeats